MVQTKGTRSQCQGWWTSPMMKRTIRGKRFLSFDWDYQSTSYEVERGISDEKTERPRENLSIETAFHAPHNKLRISFRGSYFNIRHREKTQNLNSRCSVLRKAEEVFDPSARRLITSQTYLSNGRRLIVDLKRRERFFFWLGERVNRDQKDFDSMFGRQPAFNVARLNPQFKRLDLIALLDA